MSLVSCSASALAPPRGEKRPLRHNAAGQLRGHGTRATVASRAPARRSRCDLLGLGTRAQAAGRGTSSAKSLVSCSATGLAPPRTRRPSSRRCPSARSRAWCRWGQPRPCSSCSARGLIDAPEAHRDALGQGRCLDLAVVPELGEHDEVLRGRATFEAGEPRATHRHGLHRLVGRLAAAPHVEAGEPRAERRHGLHSLVGQLVVVRHGMLVNPRQCAATNFTASSVRCGSPTR